MTKDLPIDLLFEVLLICFFAFLKATDCIFKLSINTNNFFFLAKIVLKVYSLSLLLVENCLWLHVEELFSVQL